MKHFLIFALRNVCYDSYLYFARSLAGALRQADAEVEIFSAEKEPLTAMERLAGRSFDAVFDFNSALPRLRMEEGGYFLDQIDAPFYNIILDHPLYHHDSLKQALANFHILCLDENHAAYVRQYYPHIRSARMFPMTGEDAGAGGLYPEKKIDVLFSGTYTDFRDIEASLHTCPGYIQDIVRQMTACMLQDDTLTQEAALRKLLSLSSDPDAHFPQNRADCEEKPGRTESEQQAETLFLRARAAILEEAEIIEETFPLHMQACFLCDSYLRAYKRETLLLSLAKEGIPLALCGNGWRKSPLAAFPKVSIIDDLSFQDTFSLFRQSKITLNLLPEFKCGTHDRIYSSMLNHSLCLTDPSPFLQREFSDREELCFYDPSDACGLAGQIEGLLGSPALLKEISETGYRNAKENHTWQARAGLLLSMLP